MTSLATAYGVDEGYRHVAKHARPASCIGLGDAVLKWYDIARADDPVPPEVQALARLLHFGKGLALHLEPTNGPELVRAAQAIAGELRAEEGPYDPGTTDWAGLYRRAREAAHEARTLAAGS